MEEIKIKLLIGAAIVSALFALVCLYKIAYYGIKMNRAINTLHSLQIAHQKWLFDALYSIDNKVVLPEVHEIEEEEIEPATVYNPVKDPLQSLKGHRNDWHS